ncbi:hypothetical protein CMU89_16970 [Elizabethkingia anophelis]|uniref:hypothetical protein n=1 Tax=Elizabethkingia anophelis TaxID=1117645 RepID=UPI00075191A2|nr:hypothetical protein [Elizabethkingia anophelis]AQW91315.1 hypothetical protein BBD28_11905 [Elizabethkingia anophelis]KUY14181.1 hypothetical protein ATB94_09285 [Elizabethkingia anophelis]MDV3508984.1 hypothetical protein [Elizabethkingia anophelis]MDV3544333.1 hypothetical protein [Elizabethkingia anophelis]
MNHNEAKLLYEKALEKWGHKSQLEMLQEESTELALATRKYIRNPNEETLTALASEVADVKIMIEQLAFMIPDIIILSNEWCKVKLERLGKILDENNYTLTPNK